MLIRNHQGGFSYGRCNCNLSSIRKTRFIREKAEDIALGLTIGSWTALPLLEQKQLLKHKGRVTALQEFYDDEHPNRFGEVRCEISIAYPTYNFTFDIPAILTTVFGKLSLDGEVKLLNLEFDNEDLSRFPGPKFGIKI